MGGKVTKCVRNDRVRKKKKRKTSRATEFTAQEATFEALRRDGIYSNGVQEVRKSMRYKRISSCARISNPNSSKSSKNTSKTQSTRGVESIGSKRIGNSIEILECPEMSTINQNSDCNYDSRCSADGERVTDVMKTPSQPSLYITNTAGERLEISYSEPSIMSPNAPPNSVNSQYISGIVPLESYKQDQITDITSDSVFTRDSDVNAQRLGYFLNNNSYLISPGLSSTKKGKALIANSMLSSDVINNNSSVFADASDGPGLDSDFGASAGIEMRIVSTDYSGSDRTNTTAEKHSVAKKKKRHRISRKRNSKGRPSPRLQMASAMGLLEVDNDMITPKGTVKHPGTPIVYTPVRRIAGLDRVSKRRRPATISGPETHTTMEWDPYDVEYGNNHWMEYFIPGVAYPPLPLLCPEQHWL